MRSRPLSSIWVAIVLGLLSPAVAAQPAGTAPPATTQPAVSPPALDPEVDKILTRLEQRKVKDLRARLAWQLRYVTDAPEDSTIKRGEIWYQDTKPVARFFIRFTEKIAAGRKDRLDERHLFDGQWYVTLNSRTKTVERNEVRKPNDKRDPYKIGKGMFPLPFGQKKADILREFKVEKIAPGADEPENTDHIRLIPRAQTQTGQRYRRLDFWVSREGKTAGLPVMVQVAKLDGTGKVNSYITVSFADARLNEGVSGSIFAIKTPAGYDESKNPLKPVPPPRAP